VDGVAIYEQGSNDEEFASVIGDTEKNQGFVVMYDISVEGHPSYFANGIAVHNCHGLSKDAQNALLKPLEDCPDHVYFMLCTTDPQKLIATIRNRCSQFALTLVSDEDLAELLFAVAAKEGVDIPETVINSIVSASGGSPRAALVHLDKVKDLPEDEMEKAVSRIDTNASAAIDLCRALLKDKPNWSEIAKVLSNLSGGEPEQIRMAVLGYCNAILLKGKFNGRACLVMECFKDPFYNDGKFRLTLACAASVA
jgi:DNA polymerase III gamma/tau subunit